MPQWNYDALCSPMTVYIYVTKNCTSCIFYNFVTEMNVNAKNLLSLNSNVCTELCASTKCGLTKKLTLKTRF